MKRGISLAEALELTFAHIAPLGAETMTLEHIAGRVLSREVVSNVDSPSVDASLKDGYAVQSGDVENAGETSEVILRVVGRAAAGVESTVQVGPGQAARVTTGARLPRGADAVLAEEFATESGDRLICRKTAEPGRNVLERGTDIGRGQVAARAFDHVTPALVGLLATAGIDRVEVFRNPVVCVMATGEEVVAPGKPLPEGSLYASNITEICAWLSQYGIPYRVCFAGDTEPDMVSAIADQMDHVDAFISSGGIWGSEHDLMLKVLEAQEWEGVYHRVRIGPGKAIAFGLLRGRPFFCLPGGPPSNEMAFLQIALPGVLRMCGHTGPAFPTVAARLARSVSGVGHWTQFVHAKLEKEVGDLMAVPLRQKSRLQMMAQKDGLICIPEGCEELSEGAMVPVQVLNSRALLDDHFGAPVSLPRKGVF